MMICAFEPDGSDDILKEIVPEGKVEDWLASLDYNGFCFLNGEVTIEGPFPTFGIKENDK